MRKSALLGMAMLFLATGAWAGFTPGNWTNVNSYHAHFNALNVVQTYNVGTDSVIGDFNWTGNGEAFGGSYASEARCWITAPTGQNAGFQLASGYGGLFTSGGTSNFFNGVHAIGNWTFEFYESYDDSTPDPDATHYNIQFNFLDQPPPPNYLWKEQFENGIPGNWTTTTIGAWGWTTNNLTPPTSRANLTGGGGNCADADADKYNNPPFPYDTSLITPSFVVPAQQAMLQYDMYYDDIDAQDFANVDISVDGGATWISLASYSADVAASHKSLDLSAYAGMTAQARFRYLGDSWDWYFEVDNVGPAGIPEPASFILLALGVLALRRR